MLRSRSAGVDPSLLADQALTEYQQNHASGRHGLKRLGGTAYAAKLQAELLFIYFSPRANEMKKRLALSQVQFYLDKANVQSERAFKKVLERIRQALINSERDLGSDQAGWVCRLSAYFCVTPPSKSQSEGMEWIEMVAMGGANYSEKSVEDFLRYVEPAFLGKTGVEFQQLAKISDPLKVWYFLREHYLASVSNDKSTLEQVMLLKHLLQAAAVRGFNDNARLEHFCPDQLVYHECSLVADGMIQFAQEEKGETKESDENRLLIRFSEQREEIRFDRLDGPVNFPWESLCDEKQLSNLANDLGLTVLVSVLTRGVSQVDCQLGVKEHLIPTSLAVWGMAKARYAHPKALGAHAWPTIHVHYQGVLPRFLLQAKNDQKSQLKPHFLPQMSVFEGLDQPGLTTRSLLAWLCALESWQGDSSLISQAIDNQDFWAQRVHPQNLGALLKAADLFKEKESELLGVQGLLLYQLLHMQGDGPQEEARRQAIVMLVGKMKTNIASVQDPIEKGGFLHWLVKPAVLEKNEFLSVNLVRQLEALLQQRWARSAGETMASVPEASADDQAPCALIHLLPKESLVEMSRAKNKAGLSPIEAYLLRLQKHYQASEPRFYSGKFPSKLPQLVTFLANLLPPISEGRLHGLGINRIASDLYQQALLDLSPLKLRAVVSQAKEAVRISFG